MSDSSPILALPYLMPAQAQKHVTHNEALQRLDVLVQRVVESVDATLPPASPQDGEVHALGAGALGDWAGQDGMLALRQAGAWVFVAPQAGWRAWGRAENRLRLWTGSAWAGLPVDTDMLDGVGIATAHDATNRLAVASPASLFSHAGTGGHQMKLNKAAPGDTGSVLFQTGWSGRAEIGLAGSDDLAVKVSANGSLWNTALTVAAGSGVVTLPAGLVAGGPVTGAAVTQTSSDATAGRLMKVGDFGIGSLGVAPPALGSWLRLDAPGGVYVFGATTTDQGDMPPGFASGHFGLVWVERFNASHFKLSASRMSSANPDEVWERRHSNGTWGSWRRICSQANLLGSVSLSGGVPAGAVIERGTNANGEYVRLADGTQICWRIVTALAGAGLVWTYPAAFSAVPAVKGTAVATVLSVVCLDAAPGTGSATLSARDAAGARRADSLHLTATGRWA